MKGVYVLFSSGYDSSYLVSTILDIMAKRKEDNELNLISIEGTFSCSKTDREREARERMVNYWRSKYYMIKINWSIYKVDTTTYLFNSIKTGLSQVLVWLPVVVANFDFSRYDNIELYLSYILGDQELSFKRNIENIIYDTSEITFIDHIERLSIDDKRKTGKHIKDFLDVIFPLQIIPKEDILYKLLKLDRFIFENSTTCENALSEDFCGSCIPCRVLKRTLNILLSEYNLSHDEIELVKNKLDKFNDHSDKAILESVDKEREVEG